MTAFITPADATIKDVRWSVMPTGIVELSDVGLISAKSVGEAVVTVTTEDGSFTANCQVTVSARQVAVESVILNHQVFVSHPGAREQLLASVWPVNATNIQLTWTSSDENVLIVDNYGRVSVFTPGVSTVTVTDVSGNSTACVVTGADTLEQQLMILAWVTRFYNIFLNRAPEDDGLYGWAAVLIRQNNSGREVAFGFVASIEYQQIMDDNESFVRKMYLAFFNRKLEDYLNDPGSSAWTELLNAGYPRIGVTLISQPEIPENVFDGFTGSREFHELCIKYGITAY